MDVHTIFPTLPSQHTHIHYCSFGIFFLIEDIPREAGDANESFLTNIGSVEALPSESYGFCLFLINLLNE